MTLQSITIFHCSTTLSPYLETILLPNVEVEEDEDLMIVRCKGIDCINAEHNFLKNEGHFTCGSFHECFCSTCGYLPENQRYKKFNKK